MVSQLISIAGMILLIVFAIKLLKVGAKLFSFLIWILIVSLLVYLALPWLDPVLQNVAKSFPSGSTCYGITLKSSDCFGIVN